MNKPKILFHGSKRKIKDFLEPQKATDKKSKSNSQNAVYATDRFECALGMSLTGDQKAFADYQEKDFKAVFVKEPPTPKIQRFVYEVSSDTFEENPKGSHQWSSKFKAKILKTHVYSTKQLSKYWRMATEEEKKNLNKNIK